MEDLRNATEGNRSLEFNAGTLNALLQIDVPGFALAKMKGIAEREGLFPKENFHSTIIGRETGEEIDEIFKEMSSEERVAKVQKIDSLLKDYSWSYSPVEEYYLISKQYEDGDERRSIIQMIEVPELEDFYSALNQMLGTTFLTPFPHITLYTTSTRADKKMRGIGLYSRDQFLSLNPQKLDA